MARVVVAGAGAIGASIAYHLAQRGADDVVLADVGEIAGARHRQGDGRRAPAVHDRGRGAAGAGERQALPRARRAAVRSRSATSSSRRAPTGLAELEERRAIQSSFGVPVEQVDASYVDGLRVDDVLGATICREDGIADPAGVTRELVRRAAALGVEVREHTDALGLDADVLVVACGAHSPEVADARGRRASNPPARAAARRRWPGGQHPLRSCR